MIKTDENRSYFIKAYIALESQNSNTERRNASSRQFVDILRADWLFRLPLVTLVRL